MGIERLTKIMTDKNNLTKQAKKLHSSYNALKSEVGKIIIGHEEIIEKIFIALLSNGHCLLVGVPGLAKTLLVKTIAQSLDLKFSRIQFTPDLMPSDIIGTEVIEENISTGGKSFRFVRGPVFGNIILADEINRTPPKTQSALLEVMQEHRVTAGGTTHTLTEPFFVLATQNPIEQEGTYPLPEAQLDRFMFNLWLGYPSFDEEKKIVHSTTGSKNQKIEAVVSQNDLLSFQKLILEVPVADAVVEYAVKLVSLSRPKIDTSPQFIKNWLNWGAGPRATQNLILGAKTRALLDNRFTPDIDDIRQMALPVMRHRLILNFNAEADGVSTETVIKKLIEAI